MGKRLRKARSMCCCVSPRSSYLTPHSIFSWYKRNLEAWVWLFMLMSDEYLFAIHFFFFLVENLKHEGRFQFYFGEGKFDCVYDWFGFECLLCSCIDEGVYGTWLQNEMWKFKFKFWMICSVSWFYRNSDDSADIWVKVCHILCGHANYCFCWELCFTFEFCLVFSDWRWKCEAILLVAASEFTQILWGSANSY